jgi:hypothetical protein
MANLVLHSMSLYAADEPVPSCDAIRARIGVVPLADSELLRTLASRQDCAFTAAEVYRAAYGDRPLPPPEPRSNSHRRHHDDDD